MTLLLAHSDFQTLRHPCIPMEDISKSAMKLTKWKSTDQRQIIYNYHCMMSTDGHFEEIKVDKINHLTDQQQCDVIADDFSEIPNQYSPLHKDDIQIPPFF